MGIQPTMAKIEKISGRDRWEVENDLRALRDATKIKGDRKRLSAVKALVNEEIGALGKIAFENKEGLGTE